MQVRSMSCFTIKQESNWLCERPEDAKQYHCHWKQTRSYLKLFRAVKRLEWNRHIHGHVKCFFNNTEVTSCLSGSWKYAGWQNLSKQEYQNSRYNIDRTYIFNLMKATTAVIIIIYRSEWHNICERLLKWKLEAPHLPLHWTKTNIKGWYIV